MYADSNELLAGDGFHWQDAIRRLPFDLTGELYLARTALKSSTTFREAMVASELADDEAMAVFLYTCASPLCHALNDALRVSWQQLGTMLPECGRSGLALASRLGRGALPYRGVHLCSGDYSV